MEKQNWEIEAEFTSTKIDGLCVRVSKLFNKEKPWYAPRFSIAVGKLVEGSKGCMLLPHVHVNMTGAHMVDIERACIAGMYPYSGCSCLL